MTLNTILHIAAYFVLFGFSFILAILGKPAEMSLSIIAAAIGLFFLNIDKVKLPAPRGGASLAQLKAAVQALALYHDDA